MDGRPLLSAGEARSMGEVATDCYSTRSYMTVVVDQLEDRGLVLVRCA